MDAARRRKILENIKEHVGWTNEHLEWMMHLPDIVDLATMLFREFAKSTDNVEDKIKTLKALSVADTYKETYDDWLESIEREDENFDAVMDRFAKIESEWLNVVAMMDQLMSNG